MVKEKAKKKTKAAAPKRAAKKAAAKPKAPSRAVNASPNYVEKVTMRHVRISPRKARIVVDAIKGKQVEQALQILRYTPKKTAAFAEKLLRAGIASAKESKGVDVDKLWVTGAYVDMGRTLSRYMPAAHGRATPVKKRSSHITIILGVRA